MTSNDHCGNCVRADQRIADEINDPAGMVEAAEVLKYLRQHFRKYNHPETCIVMKVVKEGLEPGKHQFILVNRVMYLIYTREALNRDYTKYVIRGEHHKY